MASLTVLFLTARVFAVCSCFGFIRRVESQVKRAGISVWPGLLYCEGEEEGSRLWVGGAVSIDGGVEFGVVVHLHLAVELEASGTIDDLGEESVETVGKVVALVLEDGEAGGVADAMGLGGGVTVSLDMGVEDLEREDGEAVEDEAGSLRVQRGSGVLRGKVDEQPLVHLLDEVVASLVEAVDGVLDMGDLGVGGVGDAGLVFFVPQVEVFAVVGGDEGMEVGGSGDGGRLGLQRKVPEGVEVGVKTNDRDGFRHSSGEALVSAMAR